METINNMASAAAKAVWGENQQTQESHEEPMSGVQGNTAKGEPFDAGNMQEKPDPVAKDASAVSTDAAAAGTTSSDLPHRAAPSATDKFTTTGTGTGTGNPAAEQPSTEERGDSTKQQGDVRDPDSKLTDPKEAAKMKDVSEGNEPDVDGPGPRPLQEVAKEHGGDAGLIGTDGKKDESAGGVGGDAEGKSQEQEEADKGMGNKYVKSTGLQVDGGDFDASRPGAGREADRLMEEKGMHPTGKADSKSDDKSEKSAAGDGSSSPGKEKTSLKDKIKSKLHKNKQDA